MRFTPGCKCCERECYLVEDFFQRPSIGSRWEVVSGTWSIQGNRYVGYQGLHLDDAGRINLRDSVSLDEYTISASFNAPTGSQVYVVYFGDFRLEVRQGSTKLFDGSGNVLTSDAVALTNPVICIEDWGGGLLTISGGYYQNYYYKDVVGQSVQGDVGLGGTGPIAFTSFSIKVHDDENCGLCGPCQCGLCEGGYAPCRLNVKIAGIINATCNHCDDANGDYILVGSGCGWSGNGPKQICQENCNDICYGYIGAWIATYWGPAPDYVRNYKLQVAYGYNIGATPVVASPTNHPYKAFVWEHDFGPNKPDCRSWNNFPVDLVGSYHSRPATPYAAEFPFDIYCGGSPTCTVTAVPGADARIYTPPKMKGEALCMLLQDENIPNLVLSFSGIHTTSGFFGCPYCGEMNLDMGLQPLFCRGANQCSATGLSGYFGDWPHGCGYSGPYFTLWKLGHGASPPTYAIQIFISQSYTGDAYWGCWMEWYKDLGTERPWLADLNGMEIPFVDEEVGCYAECSGAGSKVTIHVA